MSMDKQGVDISSAIVRRQLHEKGLYKLQLLKKPLLSDTHRLNRFKWAKDNRKTDWYSVIYTDKTTLTLFSKPKKSGERREK